MTESPGKWVCVKCGSEDVTQDGLLRWSTVEQTWVVADILDARTCNQCDDGDAELVFLPLMSTQERTFT